MRKFVCEAKLRNLRRIFRVESGYEVDHIDKNDVIHTVQFSKEAADLLFELNAGNTISAEQAADSLSPYAKDLSLNYNYGYKLQMLAQEIMLVLECQGKVKKHKEGRKYLYHFMDSD